MLSNKISLILVKKTDNTTILMLKLKDLFLIKMTFFLFYNMKSMLINKNSFLFLQHDRR